MDDFIRGMDDGGMIRGRGVPAAANLPTIMHATDEIIHGMDEIALEG